MIDDLAWTWKYPFYSANIILLSKQWILHDKVVSDLIRYVASISCDKNI